MSAPIVLPARLDIGSVNAVSCQIVDALRDGPVALDARDVTHLSALGVQLILSAARSCVAAGASLSLLNVPDRVETQISTMGFSVQRLTEGAV